MTNRRVLLAPTCLVRRVIRSLFIETYRRTNFQIKKLETSQRIKRVQFIYSAGKINLTMFSYWQIIFVSLSLLW